MHFSLLSSLAFLATTMPGRHAGHHPLGSLCTSTWECASGASCYDVSSSLSSICGNFGATCSSDSQCAFNTCVSGSCSGTLSSSSLVPAAPSTTTSAPAATERAVGLALGAACTATTQCANGAACYASNLMEVAHCGNFGATCSSNSQCAFNTCVSGSCQGTISSSTSTLVTGSGLKAPGMTGVSSGASQAEVTSTGVPAGFTTSVTVANGVTSSVLVNSAGATTSFGAVATGVETSVKGSGAGKVAGGGSGAFVLVLVGGLAMWLF
ncbi:hypothetical protein N431DRAFT_457484 [Stipitochalara longipes BDJ]|nr:hypothetical protein N431DRAFT_457484 [Stipitochalara longipes BDJ]